MIQAAKIIGTGLATTGLIGAGVGIGVVFGALILGVAKAWFLRGQLFSYATLGFALAEANGLFALAMTYMLLYYPNVAGMFCILDFVSIYIGVIISISLIVLMAVEVPLEHQLRAKHVYKGAFKEKSDGIQSVDFRGFKINMQDYPDLNWHINPTYHGFVYDNEDPSFNNAALTGYSHDATNFVTIRGNTGPKRPHIRGQIKLTFNTATVVAFGIDKIKVNGQTPQWTFSSSPRCNAILTVQ